MFGCNRYLHRVKLFRTIYNLFYKNTIIYCLTIFKKAKPEILNTMINFEGCQAKNVHVLK